MMKKLLLTFFLFIILFSLSAQVNYKIIENSYQKIQISFTFGDLKMIDVHNEQGDFSRISIDGCGGSKNIGEPELPVSVNMLEVPIFGDYVLNVYGKEAQIYEANYPVFPAQPSLSKSHEGAIAFSYNQTTYQTDDFYALPLAKFEETGIMRNVNLGTLYISPVHYNPVTNIIKCYKEIEVEIIFRNTELVKTQMIKDLHSHPLFYTPSVINAKKTVRAQEFSATPIKYLIVAHSMFRGALDEFISWKKRKGFLVDVAYTDDEHVGSTTTSIANFIKSHYDNATPENPAPVFVLLVGDVQQIPSFEGYYDGSEHPTDLYYFTWAGGTLPCCYYGRFSAQNVTQLAPQIEKTLQYERYSMPDPNYLSKISLIAGFDMIESPVYSNGFVNYATTYYANAAYGYSTVYAHLHPCNNKAAQIRKEIGAGVGIANYTAHCSPSGWYNPRFNKEDIYADMQNANKYGLMIGNCCESNKFSVNECFGEALLRTPEKGAVGYIGASNVTYWDEDYYWSIGFRFICNTNPSYNDSNLGAYDRMYHTHNELYDQWKTTFGAIITAGNNAVQASTTTADMKQHYWEIYHLMGDPSVMTYLKKPSRMTVEVLNIDLENFTLTVKTVQYAYCALTNSKNELISAGFADENGITTLRLDKDTPEDYELSAWAQNYVLHLDNGVSIKTYNPDRCFVYPNPTTGELKIENGELKIESIEIFDIYGKNIFNFQLSIFNSINISHLPAGVYFVKITTETGTITQKIVKQK